MTFANGRSLQKVEDTAAKYVEDHEQIQFEDLEMQSYADGSQSRASRVGSSS